MMQAGAFENRNRLVYLGATLRGQRPVPAEMPSHTTSSPVITDYPFTGYSGSSKRRESICPPDRGHFNDQVSQIIDDYRARWVIEEFFKALKTGCAFEKLQLESYGNLKRALSVYMPIAWQLLLLRTLAQRDDDVPAHHAMASKRLNLLRKLLLSLARYTLPEHPSASDVFFGVAKLGGHIKWNGPPGWITIGRGWNRLLEAEITASALEDVIND